MSAVDDSGFNPSTGEFGQYNDLVIDGPNGLDAQSDWNTGMQQGGNLVSDGMFSYGGNEYPYGTVVSSAEPGFSMSGIGSNADNSLWGWVKDVFSTPQSRNLLGMGLNGLATAYFKTKDLRIAQQNADANTQAVALKERTVNNAMTSTGQALAAKGKTTLGRGGATGLLAGGTKPKNTSGVTGLIFSGRSLA